MVEARAVDGYWNTFDLGGKESWRVGAIIAYFWVFGNTKMKLAMSPVTGRKLATPSKLTRAHFITPIVPKYLSVDMLPSA